ncbi:hypothetical protein MTO96_042793 [Rhipicephalus appendiculatus]
MLLRARSAGVVAYYDSSLGNDTPDSPEPESREEPSSVVSGDEAVGGPAVATLEHRLVLANFRGIECLCCREMDAPVTTAQPHGCITEHRDLSVLCLNITVLRVAYLELRSWGHTMDNEMHKQVLQFHNSC